MRRTFRTLNDCEMRHNDKKLDFLRDRHHYVDCRSDNPEQFRAIGWVKGKLYTVIFEVREDSEGECYHLVTLWKSTKQEEKLYEKHT